MIANAIKKARTEHVVYFLLTSYMEARACGDEHTDLPDEVTRFPIAGETDVGGRLHALQQSVQGKNETPPVVEEAVRVFSAAAEQLMWLNRPLRADLATREQVFGKHWSPERPAR